MPSYVDRDSEEYQRIRRLCDQHEEKLSSMKDDLKEIEQKREEDHKQNMTVQLKIAAGQGSLRTMGAIGGLILFALQVVHLLYDFAHGK